MHFGDAAAELGVLLHLREHVGHLITPKHEQRYLMSTLTVMLQTPHAQPPSPVVPVARNRTSRRLSLRHKIVVRYLDNNMNHMTSHVK